MQGSILQRDIDGIPTSTLMGWRMSSIGGLVRLRSEMPLAASGPVVVAVRRSKRKEPKQ